MDTVPPRHQLLLVDDHPSVRAALKSLIEFYPDMEVIAEAADGEQAVLLAERHQPDVVVMDVNIPKVNGIEATRRIKQAWPRIAVIGLSVDRSPQVKEGLLKAGAVTFLLKETAGDTLYPLIKDVLSSTPARASH